MARTGVASHLPRTAIHVLLTAVAVGLLSIGLRSAPRGSALPLARANAGLR